ncbi:MAG TPA: hypothetical protein VJU77_16770 [Chthoniobacterales bacterium]|nr:hypothetical protein [Chthoniobacterales bacterium]
MQDILVIDGDSERATAWATRLRASIQEINVWLITESDLARKGKARNVARCLNESCPQPDVVLIHYRDNKPHMRPAHISLPYTTFWYGGAGAEPETTKGWHIVCSLNRGDDVTTKISVPEIRKLLLWAFDPKRDPEKPPSLLRLSSPSEALPALSMLCQGYLAAFAGSNSDQHSDDLDRALDQMQFSEMPREFASEIANRFTQIRQKTWWRSPFEKANLTGETRTEAQDAGCSDIPKPILDLLKTIEEGDGQQTLGHSNNLSDNDSQKLLAEADLVAKAFCEVEKLLLKRSNELLRPNETGGGTSNTVTQGKRAT